MLSRAVPILLILVQVYSTFSCGAERRSDIHTARSEELKVEYYQNTETVPRYSVLEITFDHDREYADPFFNTTVGYELKAFEIGR